MDCAQSCGVAQAPIRHHLRLCGLEMVMCKSGELRTTPLDSYFGCCVVASVAGHPQTRVDLSPVP